MKEDRSTFGFRKTKSQMPAVFKRQYLRFARTRVQVKVWDSTQDFSVEILEIWKVQNREGEEDMKNQKQVAMLKPY